MLEDLIHRGKDMIRRYELNVGLSSAQLDALPERDKVRNEEGESWLRAGEFAIVQGFGVDSPELKRWKDIQEEFWRRRESGSERYLWRHSALVALLQELDFRLGFPKALAPAPTASGPVIHSYGGVTMQSGDTYNISKSQVGAVGPSAQAAGNTFQQALADVAAFKDLPALTIELAKLREALSAQAVEPEHHIAVGNVGAAEAAARKGDAGTTAEYLKKAGTWAFDVATKVGVNLASGALKHTLGLP
jgi:hypothetical protein